MLDFFVEEIQEIAQIKKAARESEKAAVFGLSFGARAVAAALFGAALIICPDYIMAARMHAQVSCLRRAVLVPPKGDVLTYKAASERSESYKRQKSLFDAINGADVVITCAEAVMQLFPNRQLFADSIVRFNKDTEAGSLGEVAQRLFRAGYRRRSMVEQAGDFALRGDILDIYTINEGAVRIDFFGDTVERISAIDPDTFITVREIQSVTVCPCTDYFAVSNEEIIKRLNEDALKGADSERKSRIVNELTAKLESGAIDSSFDFLAPYDDCGTILDYVAKDAVIFLDEGRQVSDFMQAHEHEHNSRYTELLRSGDVLPLSVMQQIPVSAIKDLLSPYILVSFQAIAGHNNIFEPRAVLSYNSLPVPQYFKRMNELAEDALIWNRRGYRTIICANTTESSALIRKTLLDSGVTATVAESLPASPGTYIMSAVLETGFMFHDSKLAVIGTYDVMARKRSISRAKKTFVEIAVGDYVVHDVHGIGYCEGITKRTTVAGTKDYIVIAYRDNDKLYMPIENSDLLTRYSGAEPKLSKIGGQEFANTKNSVYKSAKALAIDLVKLYSDRENGSGTVYNIDEPQLRLFSQSFPFTETEDQLSAIEDICSDMRKGRIMDRLLCGDVGYGKTEVALRAAFLTVMNNKQVALLAPTTILSEQHYRVCAERMRDMSVSVEVINRFRTPQQIRETLERTADGKVDILIGTHRLLSKDVIFKDLGILILDEEQRFGVAHKEKIKALKRNINVLTLTATPIPRTLHMSLSGIRDISTLETPPADRLPVQTYVTEYSDSLIRDAVTREISRGGQVFIVYNHVARIDRFAAQVKELVPSARVLVGHGQMDEDRLENVINSFYNGEGDVLIASTIIENGIDLPRANTIIVVDADNLGLSQLYQLKGRVGRSNRIAYAYFTYMPQKIISGDAYKRLRALMEFTELGSGFKLAMRDLEIRGAGNILGREQHGHMQKVGYEMYCRLIAKAVEEARGGAAYAADVTECKVDIETDSHIPSGYIFDDEGRMRVYSRIAAITSVQDCKKLMAELAEIYGKLPKPVINLINVGLVKGLGLRAGAERIAVRGGKTEITIKKITEQHQRAISQFSGICVLKMSAVPTIILNTDSAADLLRFLHEAI